MSLRTVPAREPAVILVKGQRNLEKEKNRKKKKKKKGKGGARTKNTKLKTAL